MQIYPSQGDSVSPFLKQKYEKEARKNWDLFYKRNENRFFKDRHYLQKEWGHLFDSTISEVESPALGTKAEDKTESPASITNDENKIESTALEKKQESKVPVERPETRTEKRTVVLEVGCGAGNTVYPLLEENPEAFVYACDFSSRAVELVKAHPSYDSQRVHAFVCDITHDDLREEVPEQSLDFVSMIFVLSAISPEKMPTALQNAARVLKPGGHVLVRDYAEGDLAQERLTGKVQKLGENFYVRGDGTRAYYFSEEALLALFQGAGFECIAMKIHERELENRARKVVMNRRWIQGTFRKPNTSPTSMDASTSSRVEASLSKETCSLQTDEEFEIRAEEKVHNTASTAAESQSLEGDSNPSSEYVRAATGREEAIRVPLASCSTAEAVDNGVGKCFQSNAEQREASREDEAANDDGEESPSMGELFNTPLEYELCEIVVAGKSFRYKALPRENQHTQPSTGLLLWESARVLASFLAAHPHVTSGRRVLEVGCGGIALPSISCVSSTAAIVATDGDPAPLELLDANVRLNSDAFELSKLKTARLRWGNEEDLAKVRSLSGSSAYDVIIGADVVYVKEAVPLLFETAALLLGEEASSAKAEAATSEAPDAMLSSPLLLLCHVIRRVSEGDILQAAKRAGFEHHRFLDLEGDGVLANSGAIRLVAFRKHP